MARTFLFWSLSAIIPALFLVFALQLGFGFNFFPFAIHQSLLREEMDEWHFIVAFDICVAILLFFVIRTILHKAIAPRKT